MFKAINNGLGKINGDRYSSYIHQILDGKNEDDPDYKKQSLEICHVAKFLCQFDNEIDIIKKSEMPDFIISRNNKIIGLEYEILVEQESKKDEGAFKDLIETVEKQYRIKYPEKKLLLTIYPNRYLSFRKTDKPRITNEIMLLVKTYITHNRLPENDYIEDITLMPHSRLDFHCHLGAWWQRTLDLETLTEAVRKKEKKISKYIINSGVNEQWLLIVIGSVGASSYEVKYTENLNIEIETGFEKVFLLEDFRANLYELK